MTIPVFFAGPTGVNGLTLNLYMDGALRRHPSAHLIALPWLGALRVSYSADHFTNAVEKKLLKLGPDQERRYGLDRPHMVVGHSQGHLVGMLHALNHPDSCKHLIGVSGPLHGAWLAKFLPLFPASWDMNPDAPFLVELMAHTPLLVGRCTNIMTPSERVMDAMSCFMETDGITNILVASAAQQAEFIPGSTGKTLFDEVVTSEVPANHLNEMTLPELRAVIWRTVDKVSLANGFVPDGVPVHQLQDRNPILRRLPFVG